MQAAIADPMSVFSARSPGRRSVGALAQTKAGYVRTGPATDDFLGLGPGLGLPAGDGVSVPETPTAVDQGLSGPATGEPAAFMIPGGLYGPLEAAYFGAPGGSGDGELTSGGGFGGGGGGSPPGGGGGGGLPPGGGGGTTPPAPPSAVPEPDMWLMLITGFFAIGSAMRAGNRRVARKSL